MSQGTSILSASQPRLALNAPAKFFIATLCFLLLVCASSSQPVFAQDDAGGQTPAVDHPAVSDGQEGTESGLEQEIVDALERAVDAGDETEQGHFMPSALWCIPFALLLLCIAAFPLIPKVEHWWHHNKNRLLVSAILGTIVLAYYTLRDTGFHHAEPGIASLVGVLKHSIVEDYIPFIVLLFSLYVISGGIRVWGDIPAHPLTNTTILGIGALMASFIGTTGASMLLIRPLLQINSERKRKTHTAIFFIFLVSNIGGCLLPIGDPPLFLGYLRGVPFMWTLGLWKEWLTCTVILLGVYYVVERWMYTHESVRDLQIDERERHPLRFEGLFNFPLLVGVILAVALLVPGKSLFGLFEVPPFLREIVQLTMAGLSWALTPKSLRRANEFNFIAINEVAALFIGIFITMQVPMEILTIKGPDLGLSEAWHFFWATGLLSSVLDNAPTYVVFFTTAGTLPEHGHMLPGVMTATGGISIELLTAISCGSVFMGAMTYIGNGPNFLVKSIAESSGVKMPSFFGYMLWSFAFLLPVFVILTFIFFI